MRANGRNGISTKVKPPKFRGTDPIYLAQRIKRDRPDIAARLARGEFRSVHQAAIAAGVIRIKTPLEKIQRLVPKLSTEERAELVAWLAGKSKEDE